MSIEPASDPARVDPASTPAAGEPGRVEGQERFSVLGDRAHSESKSPLITFYRFIASARSPQRADRSAAGSLPTRAFRYCVPATTASGFGYYVFPPIAFGVRWDGNDIIWTWDGADAWYPLKAAQFPGFREQFDAAAPPEVKEYSPPFIMALQEPGLLQVWTGLVVRTAPGWSSLVRAPANLPRTAYYELYEGLIDTDNWFGPLITNMRLTKTDVTISFQPDYPLVQVQPLPRFAYADASLNKYELVPDLSGLRAEDWASYHDTVVRPNIQEHRPRGQYAAAARKRRAEEGRD